MTDGLPMRTQSTLASQTRVVPLGMTPSKAISPSAPPRRTRTQQSPSRAVMRTSLAGALAAVGEGEAVASGDSVGEGDALSMPSASGRAGGASSACSRPRPRA